MYAQAEQREREGFYQMHQSLNTDSISCNHVCDKSQSELKTVSISQLKVNAINKDCKLTVTTITKPFQIVGCNFIVEDASNDVIIVSLYNYFQLHQKLSSLAATLPVGAQLVIKEPYVKKSSSGNIAIRIDNPHSNLVVIDSMQLALNQKLSTCTDAALLKEKGNECVKMKSFEHALQCYSAALKTDQLSSQFTAQLLSNRSLCYLKLHRYQEAIVDARKALDLDDGSMDTKIRYRLASALTGVGRYMESWHVLDDVDPVSFSSKSVRCSIDILYARTTRYFNESIDNDIEDMYDYSKIDWRDTANYYDYVKIKYISATKGRGIVATEDVKRGQRILMEKCIAIGVKDAKHRAFAINVEQKRTAKGSQINLVHDLIQIYMNGTAVDRYRISLLHSGRDFSKNKNKENVPTIDMFRYYQLPQGIGEGEVKALSVAQLDEIATKNGFKLRENQKEIGTGLFGVASFFNHDDDSNAAWTIAEKRIHVVLTKDVRKGEEICIQYHEKGVGDWLD
eukprot:CAMPEP_0202706680 /NCGR_PEP_ID=MMETSP1385-20130828/19070_1 /ASSEMBLY_ACC=CAM_ASM_000861 /TAXON_ID=933848 /ORGANISM="Elphidium margaritaceum" /LENGTH=509 /DNA_ID=CAMNT_0049365207 /DNA_START=66 /DNA_END=1595 /DNA_ORIENTATION=-